MEEPRPISEHPRPQKRPKTKMLALPYYDVGAGGGDGVAHADQDLSAHDGTRYTLTRKGFEPCKGFQSGQCTGTGDNHMCWHNSSKAHQCSYCLRTGHGYQRCRFNMKGNDEETPNKGKGAREEALPWTAKKAGKNKGKGGKQ